MFRNLNGQLGLLEIRCVVLKHAQIYFSFFTYSRCPGDNIDDEECECHKDNRWCLADGKCGLKGKHTVTNSIFMP